MTTKGLPPTAVRLAELVAALSLGVDLGFGQPMEHVLRQCVIALRLGERLGVGDEERLAVYYTGLLVNVGCHADAHEQAKWFGDDITLKSGKYTHEPGSLKAVAATMRLVGAGNPPFHRFRVGLEFALSGRRELDGMIAGHSALARGLAERLGLPTSVTAAVGAAYEQWDGHGWPGQMSGDGVPIAARLATIAEYSEVAYRLGGVRAVRALAEHRTGTQFDPALSEMVVRDSEQIFGDLAEMPPWETVIAAEPTLGIWLSPAELDHALVAVADFVDLKTPSMLGHARALSTLAAAAAIQLSLDSTDVDQLRRAGLVQGLGRLGVSNAIWDKPGPLSASEWERIRIHPYLTARMLRQSKALADLGTVVLLHRERLDGSGYPNGLSGATIGLSARILGAADAYQAMLEPRPYRPALDTDQAGNQLRREVKAGRMAGDVVEAVLAAAGHRVPNRREGPDGLTGREVEVLRLLAQGLSAKQMAQALVISPKTARNHIEHVYAKIGVTSRVTASLYAIQHGLLPGGG